MTSILALRSAEKLIALSAFMVGVRTVFLDGPRDRWFGRLELMAGWLLLIAGLGGLVGSWLWLFSA